jgi:hypothetical protein
MKMMFLVYRRYWLITGSYIILWSVTEWGYHCNFLKEFSYPVAVLGNCC